MARKKNQEIIELVRSLQTLAKKAVPSYTQEMNDIIDSNCREKQRLERTLDGMLDFCFYKNMLELFRKLCRYYYTIDQYATAEYVFAYRDMWDSEALNLTCVTPSAKTTTKIKRGIL